MGSRIRLWVQAAFAALTNGYFYGFVTGSIYTGPLKKACVPGLNCYSCPGALGSCPIGSLQSALAGREKSFPFYVVGFLLLFGSVFGRTVCGWLCPFGLVQDLLYKIPFMKKRKNLPGHRFLTKGKYLVLALFVILLPLLATGIQGQGKPWFCQYICPSGTLFAGIPLVGMTESLRETAGVLFGWKVLVLLAVTLLAVWVFRPFCKYLCPLGAFYSFFNSFAVIRYQVDTQACVRCGKCKEVCKMDIRTWETPNHPECIRCGECVKACAADAIHRTGRAVGSAKKHILHSGPHRF